MSRNHIVLSSLLTAPLIVAMALGQQPAAPQRKFANPDPPINVTIKEIPGVIAAGAQWKIAWTGDATADGMSAAPDGGLIMSQEQSNRINKIDENDKASVFSSEPHGPGSATFGPKNVVYAVERSCTDPGGKPETCIELPAVTRLTPKREVIANHVNGMTLGRVNDLTVSSTGHIYFTSGTRYGNAFHVTPSGYVSRFGNDNPTNGIVLSPDEKTLYVTNGPTVAAFDIDASGHPVNQREFARLMTNPSNGDGMAVDADGRLYVTSNRGIWGIHVFDNTGKPLGMIPTPRSPITLAFAGKDKKTLYVGGMGWTMPDGKEFTKPETERNVAMTVYKVPMIAQGYKGRAK